MCVRTCVLVVSCIVFFLFRHQISKLNEDTRRVCVTFELSYSERFVSLAACNTSSSNIKLYCVARGISRGMNQKCACESDPLFLEFELSRKAVYDFDLKSMYLINNNPLHFTSIKLFVSVCRCSLAAEIATWIWFYNAYCVALFRQMKCFCNVFDLKYLSEDHPHLAPYSEW